MRVLTYTLAALCGLVLMMVADGCSKGQPGSAFASLRARFSSGQHALQESLDAKKEARSWRMQTLLKMHPGRALETSIEVSCPDRERIVTTLGEAKYETVRIGEQAWSRQVGSNWQAEKAPPEAYPCGTHPGAPAPWAMMNEGRDLATVVATMAKQVNAQVDRGDQAQVGGQRCQQWVVSFQHPGGNGRAMKYSVCIGDDHLPREVVMGSGGLVTTYSDWNKPVQIDAPAANPSPPSATPSH